MWNHTTCYRAYTIITGVWGFLWWCFFFYTLCVISLCKKTTTPNHNRFGTVHVIFYPTSFLTTRYNWLETSRTLRYDWLIVDTRTQIGQSQPRRRDFSEILRVLSPPLHFHQSRMVKLRVRTNDPRQSYKYVIRVFTAPVWRPVATREVLFRVFGKLGLKTH